MKKIIALALALIMALSMASVAFAAYTGNNENGERPVVLTFDGTNKFSFDADYEVAPGTKLVLQTGSSYDTYKVSYDFTKGAFCGASMVEGVKLAKNKSSVELTIKENYTLADEAKDVVGEITLTKKGNADVKYVIAVDLKVNNNAAYVMGEAKAEDATNITAQMADDTVIVMDDTYAGYVKFVDGVLTGTVKMAKEEEAFVSLTDIDPEVQEAIEEYMGEDYEAIVEYYAFAGKGFKNDVDFAYDAYEEDPHFFYAWDGEKLVDLGAKFDADEDVEAYVWTGAAEGVIVVTDVEIVAADEETKNPDTGANDVVGVAAALAVVSLVAAGAVSLKK